MKFRTFKISLQLVQDIRRCSGGDSGFTLKEDRLTVDNLEDFRGWIYWYTYSGSSGTSEVLSLFRWVELTVL